MTDIAAAPTSRSAAADGAVSPTLRARLEPVREALVRDAEVEAEQIIAAATAAAEQVVAAAQAQSDLAVTQARHRAELSAKAYSHQALARVGTDARRAVLVAQQEIMHQLIDEVHASIAAISEDPLYPQLLDRLTAAARSQLGDEATVERDREPGGGVIARSGSRQVDYRLTALADRALETIADQVAELWR